MHKFSAVIIDIDLNYLANPFLEWVNSSLTASPVFAPHIETLRLHVPYMLFKKCLFKKYARRDVIKVTWKGYEKIVKIIKENKTKQVIETKLKN